VSDVHLSTSAGSQRGYSAVKFGPAFARDTKLAIAPPVPAALMPHIERFDTEFLPGSRVLEIDGAQFERDVEAETRRQQSSSLPSKPCGSMDQIDGAVERPGGDAGGSIQQPNAAEAAGGSLEPTGTTHDGGRALD
jgi:hypothetical protein